MSAETPGRQHRIASRTLQGQSASASTALHREPDKVGTASTEKGNAIETDPYRLLLFPNAMRRLRRRAGYESLTALSQHISSMPYVRLAKIERGEVFAKARELTIIAATLKLSDPTDLLIDVEDRNFSLPLWAELRHDDAVRNREGEELAVLLAAAFRARRATDPELTIARLQSDHGLPAVIISRIENATKAPDRWNNETLAAIARILGVKDYRNLAAYLREEHARGALNPWLASVPGAKEREARTRKHIRALREELALAMQALDWSETALAAGGAPKETPTLAPVSPQSLQVVGVPIGDGVIDPYPNPEYVTPPLGTGANCYALRMCRASLGSAIPASAVLIVDPDRPPLHSGLAVLREEKGLRVLSVTTDREGRLYGHSSNPKKDVPLDGLPPSALATVMAILLV